MSGRMPSITSPLRSRSELVDVIHSRSRRVSPAPTVDSLLDFFGLVRPRFVHLAMAQIWFGEDVVGFLLAEISPSGGMVVAIWMRLPEGDEAAAKSGDLRRRKRSL